MKRKPPEVDIEKVIGEVVSDHVPGRAESASALLGRTAARNPARPAPLPDGLPGDLRRPEAERTLPDDAGARERSEAAGSDAPDASPAPEATGSGRERGAARRADRRVERLRAELGVLRGDLDRARAERRSLRDELHRETRRRESLERDLAVERERHEAAARERFEAWRREVGIEFGATAERKAVEAEHARNSDLLARAARALERQAALNARYGTVRALREEFERIGKAIGELRFAEGDSLKLVPDLKEARRALESQRSRLLADPVIGPLLAQPGPVAVPLAFGAIDALPDGKQALPVLERIQALIIPALRETGLVDASGADALAARIGEKFQRVVRAEVSRSTVRPGAREETFEALVRDGRSARHELLVDGNNVLLSNGAASGGEGGVAGFAGRRERLNRLLERIAQAFRHVYAVYDGNEDREEPVSGTFTTVFTCKRHRLADDWIAERVAREPEGRCIVATDDGELMARCARAHATIGARHLNDYLSSRLGG